MYDSLRKKDLLPLTQPFTALDLKVTDDIETAVAASDFQNAASDQDDIVDWILVELRDKDYPEVIVAARPTLVQRDGDIVGLDAQCNLSFDNMLHKAYYIAIRHRNHFGIMTATTYDLDENGVTLDFTDSSVATYGTAAQKDINGTLVMWKGDANRDGVIK